jgi:hypothetical protein
MIATSVAVGTMAMAAIPTSGGVFTGCYNKNSGALRVIDTATQTCTAREREISWNEQGVPGPAGPQVCPEGKEVLGGGGHVNENGDNYLRVSQPIINPTYRNGWGVGTKLLHSPDNPDTWTPQITVYAICANAD